MARVIIRGSYCSLVGAPPEALAALENKFSYEVQGAEYTDAYKDGDWNGRYYVFKDRHFTVGLLKNVIEALKQLDIETSIDDRRRLGIKKEYVSHPEKLRTYQEEIVSRAIAERSSSIQVATGGGKTRIGGEFIVRLGYKTIWLTPNVEILKQTQEVLSEQLDDDIGIIGGGQYDTRHVTVATWQSIQDPRYFDFLNSMDIMVVDEAQHIGANILRKVEKSIPAVYRLGMSGTLWREDGADLQIISACGPKIAEVSYTDLITGGYLVPPRITILKFPGVMYNEWNTYADVYQDYVVDNEFRNQVLTNAARNLLAKGRRVLIFCNRVEHGQKLAQLGGHDFLYSTSYNRRDLIDGFRSGDIRCLISTSVLQEGFDVPSCDALILAGPQKSMIATLQKIGRVLRPFEGKTDAIVVDTADSAKYLWAGYKRRFEYYQKERAFKIERVLDMHPTEEKQ